MHVPQSERSRLRLATKLLQRFIKWSDHIADAPRAAPGCKARLVQDTRTFLRALAAPEPATGEANTLPIPQLGEVHDY
jgi:hypothetical protein